MSKSIKNNVLKSTPSFWLAAIIIASLLAGFAFTIKLLHADRYNQSAEVAGTVAIRELIIGAVEGLKRDAPIEAKTGDIYFPEARLMLPASPLARLTYAYEPDSPDINLTVSDHRAISQASYAMYNATSTQKVFEAAPKLQSCSRGVRVLEKQITTNEEPLSELKGTVQPGNGKTLYLYVEKECATELNDTVEFLKKLKAY